MDLTFDEWLFVEAFTIKDTKQEKKTLANSKNFSKQVNLEFVYQRKMFILNSLSMHNHATLNAKPHWILIILINY